MTNLDAWPIKRIARIAGALSIGSGLPDGFSIYGLKKVFVKDDAAATAANILQFETLFRSRDLRGVAGLPLHGVQAGESTRCFTVSHRLHHGRDDPVARCIR